VKQKINSHDEFDELRYELKMVYDGLQLFEMRRWVRSHCGGFITAYPARKVNNIYFDTIDFDTLSDHLSGVSERRKLRYRWYGNTQEQISGHLEIKQKLNRLGSKLRQRIAQPLELNSSSWEKIMFILRNHTVGYFYELLHISNPILINRYDREYYVTADGKIRLTLDYNHKSYDQRFSLQPNLRFAQPMLERAIIEFKTDVENSAELANIIAEFPLRVSQHSKFLDSMDSILTG
jgi:hypothetical protein